MNILSWFRPRRGPSAEVLRATASASGSIGYAIAMNLAGNSTPDIDQTAYLLAYQISPWVNRCVQILTGAVSSVPLALRDANGGSIEKHPVLNLLSYVNAEDNWQEIITSTVGFELLAGDMYWLLDKPDAPSVIWPLRPDRIEIKTNKKIITGYAYKVGGQTKTYPAELIIHFKRWNPVNTLYGQSQLMAGETVMNLDKAAREFNWKWMKSDTRLSGFLSVDGDVGALTQEQREAARSAWQATYGGTNNTGKVAFLGSNLKFTPVSQPVPEGAYTALREDVRQELSALFGVPPIYLGKDDASYANAEVQKDIFWDTTVLGDWVNHIVSRLNQDLLPRFGDGLELVPNLSEIPAMQDRKVRRATQLLSAVGGPFLSVNEARRLVGEDDWGPEADLIYKPKMMGVLGEEQKLPAPPKPPTPSPEEDETNTEPDEDEEATTAPQKVYLPAVAKATRRGQAVPPFGSEAHAKAFGDWVALLRPHEQAAAATAERLYLQALDKVVRKLDAQKIYKATRPNIEVILDGVFTEEFAAEWAEEFRPHHEAALSTGAKLALAEIGGGLFDLNGEAVQRFLAEKALKVSLYIPESQKEELRQVLLKAQEEGVGIGEMVQRLQELEPRYRYHEAERVARTEVVGSANGGKVEAFKQNGVKTKVWSSAGDERVRETHAEAHGQEVGINETFVVGDAQLMQPGDPDGPPEEIINCRCTMLVGLIEGEDEDE